MTEPRRVAIVPHTHWDREWYEPFQRFRMRLVDVVDDVLVRAEADPDFRFTFDGQMAAVEDYLEVRPHNRDRFAALVRSGRFAIGPWRVLLDEFLCSGENIVRNLQLGHRQAASLGGAMNVGYLPDMFGHIAQMPQILRAAGLMHACVYRGVPAAVTGHRFRWEAPDGTGIDTEYLIAGYGNISDLFDEPGDLPGRLDRRLARFEAAFDNNGDGASVRRTTDPGSDVGRDADEVLAMYGTDHSGPLPTLMPLVRRLDAERGGGVRVTTLPAYLAATLDDVPIPPVVRGELRSHARANILPGVISVRPHLKQALAAAERMVERYAEPLQALWGTAWPDVLLDLAWGKLVDCSCHDSVTGCGVDDTAIQVAARIAEAGHIGQAVRDDVMAGLAGAVPADAVMLANPSPRWRRTVVVAELPAPGDGPVELIDAAGNCLPMQVLHAAGTVLADETVDGGDLGLLFRRVHDRELFGRQIRRMTMDLHPTPPCLTFEVTAGPQTSLWDHTLERGRAARAGRDRPGPWRWRIVEEPRRTVAALVDVPPLGLSAVRLVPRSGEPEASALPDGEPSASATGAATATVTASDAGLTGDGVVVLVLNDGTLRIERDGVVLEGVGRLSDGGDAGDSYNHAPPAADLLVNHPESVAVRILHSGPVLAALRVTRQYAWPIESGRDSRSVQTEPVEVDMDVEVRAGEPFVRLRISFDNRTRDHRLRLHVPCARPDGTSSAGGQFAVVRRDGAPESGPVGEFPIPTYPASAFVDAGGAGVLVTGPTEYELLSAPDELALTLMRSVGFLSRNDNRLRDEPAGPNLPTPLAQSPGPHTVRLAVLPHRGDWREAGLAGLSEDFLLDPVVRAGMAPRNGPLPAPRAGLELAGAGVQLSAVVAAPASGVDVRIIALTDRPTVAVLTRPERPFRDVRPVDLLGAEYPGPLGEARAPRVDEASRCVIPLRPWEIRTVRLS